MEKTHVFIVILNYKRWQDVTECLESLFRQNYKEHSIIVLDNDSQNDSLAHLITWVKNYNKISNFKYSQIHYNLYNAKDLERLDIPESLPYLTFIQNPTNSGFASGNNVILNYLQYSNKFIWLLNPDMVADQNALSELVVFSKNQSFKTIIGTVIKSYENPEKILLYGGATIKWRSATIKPVEKVEEIKDLDYICGGSLFLHAKHLIDIGLLSEDYFLFWEETDWCYNAKLKGYKMAVCLTAICYDKVSTSIGKGSFADFYYTLNGLKFVKKFKHQNVKSVLLFSFLRIGKRIVTGRFDQANGAFRGLLAFLKVRNENK